MNGEILECREDREEPFCGRLTCHILPVSTSNQARLTRLRGFWPRFPRSRFGLVSSVNDASVNITRDTPDYDEASPIDGSASPSEGGPPIDGATPQRYDERGRPS